MFPDPGVRSGVTVCVVEDHASLREQLCELLADSGAQVLAAVGNVRDGEAAVTEYQPDVAVIDNRLPDGRGIDLIRSLAIATPEVTLLLHTATAAAADRRDALRAGAAAVVVKSIMAEDLLEAVWDAPPTPRPHTG